MSPETKSRTIRMIIYVIVGFLFAFLYGYLKNE